MQSNNYITLLIDKKYFRDIDTIGRFGATKVLQIDTNDEYVKKILNNSNFSSDIDLLSYCDDLHAKNYQFYLSPSYVIIDQDNTKRYLLYPFIHNQSLKEFLEHKIEGKVLTKDDEAQKYKILYCIIDFLMHFHADKRIHGNLKLSNILLDDNFLPLVTDSKFITPIAKEAQSKDNSITDSSNQLNVQQLDESSDIFSLAIIMIQILANKIIDFPDNEEIYDVKVANDVKLLISNCSISKDLSEKLNFSLSLDPSTRPTANELKKTLEAELKNKIGDKSFTEFTRSFYSENEKPNKTFEKIQAEAKKGDQHSIFKLGCYLLTHQNPQKRKEGMDYIRFISGNYDKAKVIYDNFRKDVSQYISGTSVKSLIYDHTFNSDNNLKISQTTINSLKKEQFDIPILDIDKKSFDKYNFIPTKGALTLLAIIDKYIKNKAHLIIEGDTGTAKTSSVEIICKQQKKKLIRVNLSSDTKSSHLTSIITNDKDKWSGLDTIKGPYLEAYENGYVLLLDEINLANHECLTFINESLDHDYFSTQFNGEYINAKKHEDFILIATQNPNKGAFKNLRKELAQDFKSRFTIIDFKELATDEILNIAKGLAILCEYKEEKIVEQLVSLYVDWTKEENKDDNLCFTIREIAYSIQALKKGEVPYDVIMNIFGSRYEKEKKEKLRQLLKEKYPIFKSSETTEFQYFNQIHNIKKNSSLSSVFKTLFSAIENGKHVIVASKSGNGVTYIVRLFAQWYQKVYQHKKNVQELFLSCTIDAGNDYFIGKNKPSKNLNEKSTNNQFIEWADGFLIKALKENRIAVIDNVDEALSTILERFNSLLDKNVGEYFETFENPTEKTIQIDEDFRLICTCKLENLDHMSPAFVNRFHLIVLEDQIEKDESNLKDLIKILLKQAHKRILCAKNLFEVEKRNQSTLDDDDNDDSSSDDDDDSSSDDDSISMNAKIVTDDTFEPDSNSINLIYKKVKDLDFNMRYISQLCNAVTKFNDYFNDGKIIEKIIQFSINLLDKDNDKDFEVPKEIKDRLLSDLLSNINEKSNSKKENDRFFFEHSPPLLDLMIKVYACSLINLPVCIKGDTGIGKTSFAIEFGRIRPIKGDQGTKYLMQPFSSETKPKDYIGVITIKDSKIDFSEGTLLRAMKHGLTLILDEFNLSLPPTMKSIAPALEPVDNNKLYFSGVDDPISVHPDFFMILCQNETGYRGRNEIPNSIRYRFRNFNYPKLNIDNFRQTAIDIANSLYDEKELKLKCFTDEIAALVGQFMISLNNSQVKIQQWSIRDFTKFFQRIHYQDVNAEKFIIDNDKQAQNENMKLLTNLLFYTFSSMNKNETMEVLNPVLNIIGEVFGVEDLKLKELEKCFSDNPKLESDEKGKYLIKGMFKIYSSSLNGIKLKLPSLLNGMFQILLCDPSEPILLIGPSGMKTYIAQQFLKDAKIISLHPDSTISQFLGSTAFFGSKLDAKLFYLKYICSVCQLYDELPNYIEALKNGTLKDKYQEELSTKIDAKKKCLPESFRYSIDHLFDKLFDKCKDISKKCVLSNMELEFRPGLLLWAILEGKSLILKNLSNLPTNVLERFNELFSVMPTLTLNEDTHSTVVYELQKELTNFKSNFRIFAIDSPNSLSQLSEAVLSRFSVISISSYENDEQKLVLEGYVDSNKLKFNKESFIPKIIEFANKMEESFSKSFSFPKMINIIEMCSRLNENSDESLWLDNLKAYLFYVGYGILEQKNKKTKDELVNIFNEMKIPLESSFTTRNDDENTLSIEKVDGDNFVKSIKSGFSLKAPLTKETDSKDIAFIPTFQEILEVLMLAFTTKNPAILVGKMPGQGKQTAINYIAKMLGYDVVNIIISKSTTIEDILGRISITYNEKNEINVKTIHTKLVETLMSNDLSKKSIIVFHNLNLASPGVLAVVNTIFDQNQKNLLHSDGSIIEKGELNLVGIFNQQNGLFNLEKLSSSLRDSSICHFVNNPNEVETLTVITKLFENTEFLQESFEFHERFIKANKFAESENALLFSLSDIKKYKIFREVAYGKFDKDTITLMILVYRFIHQEQIDKVRTLLNLPTLKFNLSISKNVEKNNLFIKPSKEAKSGISIQASSKAKDTQYIKEKIASLTLSQKHCLLFLICSYISKQTCIIQGETASGKSYLIRLFAEILGKELKVIQLNSEISSSIITGQSKLSNELSDKDIEDFNNVLSKLKENPRIKEYISSQKVFEKDPKEWKRNYFTRLIDFLKQEKERIIQSNQDCEKQLQLIKSMKAKIKELILPAKRFRFIESILVEAMQKGELILFDGIEKAPPEIAEKISQLCNPGNDQEIDIVECGEGHHFTRKKNIPGTQQIHEDFRLFITYNPTSQIESKQLDPVLMDKCALSTVTSLDSTPENLAQFLFGMLIQKCPKDLALELSKRLANMYKFVKDESLKGDRQITARLLKFVIKEFNNHFCNNKDNPLNDLHIPIRDSMIYSFLLPLDKNDDNEFKEKMINAFLKDLDDESFKNLWYDDLVLSDKYPDILKYLRNIQISSKDTTKSSNFNFSDFVSKCLLVHIIDVPIILTHIKDTIDFISKSDCYQNYSQTILDNEFYQLKMIEHIFESVQKGSGKLKDEHNNFTLKDPELLVIKDLIHPLSQLTLLSLLASNESKCKLSGIPRILLNNDFILLMKLIYEMSNDDDKIQIYFKEIMKILYNNPSFIPFIETRIPYNQFNKPCNQIINYLMPMIRTLHKLQQNFHITICNQTFDFEYLEQKQTIFEPFLVFENKNELTLSPSQTYVKINDYEKKYETQNDIIKLIADELSKLTKSNEITQCNSIITIQSLLSNGNQSLIGNIWTILFSFPQSKEIEVFSNYLQGLEKETIILFNSIFHHCEMKDVKKVYDFSNKMIEFGNENKYLWQIKNNLFKVNKNILMEEANALIKNITDEINYLEENKKIIMPADFYKHEPKTVLENWILLLENSKDPIHAIIDLLIQKNENLKNRKELSIIRAKLLQTQVKHKNAENLKQQILKQIGLDMMSDNLSEDKVKNYDEKVEEFLKCLDSVQDRAFSNDIIYPEVKLYESIIWFSLVYDIINSKIKLGEENIFENIMKLSNYEGTSHIVDVLTNRLFQVSNNSSNKISDEDFNNINSMLNAQLLNKMRSNNDIEKINSLDVVFNDLEKRNLVSEKVIHWIENKRSQYPPGFKLILPEFKPRDLLFLFISIDSNGKTTPGPILSSIDYNDQNEIIKQLSNVIPEGINKATQYSEIIIEKLKDKSLISNNILHEIQIIAEKIDTCKKFKFTFNDIGFINKKWMNDQKFIQTYPSLVFWMVKNYREAARLQNIFSNVKKFTGKELPFIIFELRLKSSENCIVFDCSSKTQTGQYFQKSITNAFRDEIKNNESIGTKWLNVLLPSLPQEMIDPDYQMFYQYFINISEDDTDLDSIIQILKEDAIDSFVKNVCKLVFNNEINSLLDYKGSKLEQRVDEIYSFIKDPNEFVGCLVQSKVNNEFKQFVSSEGYKCLTSQVAKMKKEIDELVNQLVGLIDKEINDKNKIYEDEAQLTRLQKIKDMKKSLSKSINDYKRKYQILSNNNSYLKFKTLQSYCDYMQKDIKNIPNMFRENDVVSLIKLRYEYGITSYRYNPNKHSCKIEIARNQNGRRDKISLKPFQDYYFYPWQINDNVKEMISNKLRDWTLHWETVDFAPVSENFDIDNYCESTIQLNNSKKASIFFGSQIKQNVFIRQINDISKQLINSVERLDKECFSKNIINKQIFEIIDEKLKQTDALKSCFYAKFQDGTSIQNKDFSNIMSKMCNYFVDINRYLNAVNKYLQGPIDRMWKASYDNSRSLVKAFNLKRQFKLPTNYYYNQQHLPSVLFQNIKNNDFFSNPILSIDNGSIKCCFDSLNCAIGPIIPALYGSKRARINFLSFIDDDLSIEIQINDKDEIKEKYECLFPSKRVFSNGDLVQIFVSLPEEDATIKTMIHFSSEKYSSLDLPCIFSFKILPLSILISCKEHQLAFKDNSFYLCQNHLILPTKLNFVVQNYYLNEKINYKYQILSLEGNTSPNPEIRQKDDGIEIDIPKTNKAERLHAELKLKFTDQITTSIFIDSKIIPFEFAFDIYDPGLTRYVSDTATIYYSREYFHRDIKLHLRLQSPYFFDNCQGTFWYNLPKELFVKNRSLDNKFIINENKEFDMVLAPSLSSNSIDYYRYENYYFKIKINGVEKTVYLKFSEVTDKITKYNKLNDYYVKKYPTYGYQGKWRRIQPYTSLMGYCLFISPFSFTLFNQASISYNYDCETKYASDNMFVSINYEGKYIENHSSSSIPITIDKRAIGWSKFFDDCTTSPYFYSIYGKTGNDWYPVYDKYPEFGVRNVIFVELEFDHENIEIAKANIDQYEKSQTNMLGVKKGFGRTNFRQFHLLLLSSKVIKNIKYIIKYLPDEIKIKFDSIIAAAESIDVDDPRMIILKHNAIILFRKVFFDKYLQIRNAGFKISHCPLEQANIDFYVNDSYEMYCSVDENAANYDIYSCEYKKFKSLKKEMKKIETIPIPENAEKYDIYLITCKENLIQISNGHDKTRQDISKSSSQMKSNDNVQKIKIEMPNIFSESKESLQSIGQRRDFYNTLIKSIRLLPVFVSVMKSKNDQQMEKEAIKILEKLNSVYTNLPEKDYSFISSITNLYIDSFNSMIGIFKAAGVNFGNLIFTKSTSNSDKYQGFVELPAKDTITPIPPEKWRTYWGSGVPDPQPPVIPDPQPEPEPEPKPEPGPEPEPINNPMTTDSYSHSEITNHGKVGLNNPKFVKMVAKYRKQLEINANQNDTESDTQLNNGPKTIDSSQEGVYVVSKERSLPISNIKMDGFVSKFNDQMGIERAINRILEMNDKIQKGRPILKIYESEPHIVKNQQFLDTSKTDFPVSQLMQNSYFFANKFFIAALGMTIPRSEISVNILIDCSSFISDENKLFNMMIICALTHVLNYLNIPYSTAVIADQEFKCIIKEFDEPHSPKCLQKMCDCLLIKRFRTKLASSIKFANEKMKYPKEEERPYRAIFVFTDGLDEQLVLSNAWSKDILINDLLSYGFIFMKSLALADDNSALLKQVWNNFENVVNKGKVHPILKIAAITAEINEEISNKLVDLFRTVMYRSSKPNENKVAVYQYENPILMTGKLTDEKRILRYLKVDYSKLNESYAKQTDVFKNQKSIINKLDLRSYKNMLNRISKCELNQNINREQIIKEFLINRISIDQTSLEVILKPNKASQLVLSSTGTEFDIIALVLNLINPVPNPMIYLELKGGYVRNYSVSVIIDPSTTCFDELSGPHSLQTIQTVLSSLAVIDIQSFDLIVAGNPKPNIICSDVGTLSALSGKSSLYDSLFTSLQKPIQNPDLASAIKVAFDLGRIRPSDTASILLVLTNGMYQNEEADRIINSVNMCVQNGINTFGIGVGVYPKGIEKLFPQVVFSQNPSDLMKTIASLYNGNTSIYNKMSPINISPPNSNVLKSVIEMLIKNKETPVFKSLIDELKEITPYLDAFDDMYNHEEPIYDEKTGTYINPVGINTEMYVKDLLKTQKILIVMLWDYTLNVEHEQHFVHPEYITKSKEKSGCCIKKAADYYGVSLKIVQNYEDAINELITESTPGYCDYYAVWVFCGPPFEILPDKKKDPHYVGEFNKVLLEFWRNGGSIVFWAEGEPLNYQVNLFLEEVVFEDEPDLIDGRTCLRIHGEHQGEQILLPDESGSLQKNGTFNRSPNIFKQCQRPMLSNNIGKIFEGISIGYAEGSIHPFKALARGSGGEIISLFYPANISKGTGDIIIDCGYTKCFTKMDTDGTYRLIENFIGWTGRPEAHLIIDNKQPSEWRPKGLTYKLPEEKPVWNRFQALRIDDPKKLKTVWAIDSSESVRDEDFYHNELRKIVKIYYKPEDKFFLWDNQVRKITYEELNRFMTNKEGFTGTKSSLIADIAQQSDDCEHLIIVTDGTVDNNEIDESDRKMNEYRIRFRFVTTFIIIDANPPYLTEIKRQYPNADIESMKLKCDLSVGAPYCRRCQNVTYAVRKADGREPMASLSVNDINALNGINSILSYEAFEQNYNNLQRAIQASSLGKEKDEDLVNRLEALKKRILSCNLSKQQLSKFNHNIKILLDMANGGLRSTFTLNGTAAANT